VTRLLYCESYDDVHKALAREKQLKEWTRAKKLALIVRRNPHWVDLASEWYPWMKSEEGRDASTLRLRSA
jgi:putative endonuclease